jgi:hypothetical protein
MQGLPELIQSSLEELGEWRKLPERMKWPLSFYDACERLLNRAGQCKDISELRVVNNKVSRLIIDSGPLDASFLPSLNDISVALEKHNRYLAHKKG